MANTISEIKPAVIATVGTAQANPEGEMDALLLGRTRVSTVYFSGRLGSAIGEYRARVLLVFGRLYCARKRVFVGLTVAVSFLKVQL